MTTLKKRSKVSRLLDRNQLAQRFFTEAQTLGIEDREIIEKAIGHYMEGRTQLGFDEQTWPQPEAAQIQAYLTRARNGDQAAPQPQKRRPVKKQFLPSPAPFTLTENARRVLEKRYLKRDNQGQVLETPEEMFRRVANNIASAELIFNPQAEAQAWEEEFYNLMISGLFMPNSPTLMNAGRELQQLSACFVLPIEDSMESIFDAVKYTALIHKSGGGTGFSFSRLRPEQDTVGSTGGVASGPVSFMRAFDIATEVIKQGGMRRGANMGILNVHHPDILKFITAKQDPTAFTNFNISVAITEDFMHRVEKGEDYELINPHTGQVAGKLNAKKVFDLMVETSWRTGDPGIVFIDRINEANPTPHLGSIESTNPCGEQPLLPYESCNLGSINLSRLLKRNGRAEVDYERLGQVVEVAVRFLDNVIEVNHFPIPRIADMTLSTRKIGLGVMGFADMLLQMGIPYDSDRALKVAEGVMGFINVKAFEASAALVDERGPFPTFEGSIYDKPGQPQLRNSTRTTIAPTGTISTIAGCSSGIEPLYALSYERHVLDGDVLIEVNPYFEEVAKKLSFSSPELMAELARGKKLQDIEGVPEEIKHLFVTSHDISPEWHVKMQAAFQKHTDNAVSKTVNLPYEATTEDVAQVYRMAYQMGLKGITIYRDRSRESQVLVSGGDTRTKEKASTAPTTAITPRPRPKLTTKGYSEKVSTGCGNLYVMINSDERGICDVFASLGHAGGCASAQLEATGRLISMALRSGLAPEEVVNMLKGIRCPSIAWDEGKAVLSCADAIGSVLERYLQGKKELKSGKDMANALLPPENYPIAALAPANLGKLVNLAGQCPECGGLLMFQEGCFHCPACGYTKC
ncbi:MAG: vitamin B12-dependent ribonucleotide reductase [Chloroflexota bacterium]